MAGTSLRITPLALAVAGLIAWISPPPALAKSAEVAVRDFRFEPAEAKIDAGDEVIWTNQGRQQHTISFDGGEFDSNPSCQPGVLLIGCMAPGDTVRHRFARGGEFRYTCRLHSQMRGTVTVRGATTTTVQASTTTEAPTTTATTRPLTTSSAPVAPTTVSTTPRSTFEPGSAPAFDPGQGPTTTPTTADGSESAGRPEPRPSPTKDREEGTDSGTIFAIVGALAAVSLGGGYLLLRMRPGRRS